MGKLSSRMRSAKRQMKKIFNVVTTRAARVPFTIQWLMRDGEYQRLKNASAALLVVERARNASFARKISNSSDAIRASSSWADR